MSKLLFLINLFLITSSVLLAQQPKSNHGIVRGTITTSDGQPAPYVSVKIEGTRLGAVTNTKGQFTIKHVAPGAQLVKVSAVGTVAQEKSITVEAGQTLQIDFVLNEDANQLQEVIVLNNHLNKENRIVAKMPLKNLENPQVYNTVSSEIMKQQGIANYDDAFRNVAGIARTWESTGRAGDGAAYFALRGFDAQPLLTNGLPGLVSGNLDPANVEEIQVIKGPSGTLFGGSVYSYGGMINTITKKPHFGYSGEVGYQFGSFGLNRITADINTPLSKKEKIALRVNAAYHTENSFQDAGFKKSFFLAPSLAYVVNDRLSFQVMTEILEEERAVAPVFFHSDRVSPLPFKNLDELNLNNKLSFTSNDLTIKNPRYNLQAQMIYKLSGQWTSQTVVSRGSIKADGYYSYIWDDVSGDNWFSHYFHKEQYTLNTTDMQQNFNGDFYIGNLRNRLLVGLDYFNRNAIDNGSGWVSARNVTPQGDVNYVDPYTGDTLAPVYLTKAGIDNLLAGSGANSSNISNSSYSAYASDILNITPNLMLMASVRVDYFDSKGEKNTADDDFDQTAVSPKFGVVYQPIPEQLSLFANYMNGFINVAPRQVADPDGSNGHIKSFRPEQANQLEYGVKANLFAGKLLGTASIYDIRVSDRVMPEATNRFNYVQGGEVSSKGLEVDVTVNPVNGLNLMAGYSYNKTKVISGDKDDFYSEPGRSIGGQGPQNLANLWATYKFPQGKLQGFGIGVGGNYASEYKVIDNSKTGVFVLPSYTLVNASVFYNGDHVRVSCNVNNLTNKQYYIGYWSVNPQKRSNYVVSVAYKF